MKKTDNKKSHATVPLNVSSLPGYAIYIAIWFRINHNPDGWGHNKPHQLRTGLRGVFT